MWVSLKPGLKIIKMRQINWTEHLFCSVNRINLTNVLIFHNKKILTFRFWLLQPFFYNIFRSSHQRCSVKKGVFRNFAKFVGKHLCQSLFFNKVADLRLYQKRDSGIGAFLWILRNFKEHLVNTTSVVDYFWYLLSLFEKTAWKF